jgi:hypothetical protein
LIVSAAVAAVADAACACCCCCCCCCFRHTPGHPAGLFPVRPCHQALQQVAPLLCHSDGPGGAVRGDQPR